MMCRRASLHIPLLAIDPPAPFLRSRSSPAIDELASFPSGALKAFHRKIGKCMAALVEGHMPWAGVAIALSCLESGSSRSILVSTSGTQVNPRLEVRVGDVDEYDLVPESRCRRVSEASPRDNDVHAYSRALSGDKGCTACPLMAGQRPFQEAGGRVDQWLALVYLCACAVTQMRMSCAGARFITGGPRRRQVLLDPQMSPGCIQRLLGWCVA